MYKQVFTHSSIEDWDRNLSVVITITSVIKEQPLVSLYSIDDDSWLSSLKTLTLLTVIAATAAAAIITITITDLLKELQQREGELVTRK